MTTAADLIQVLQRRLRLSQYRSRPGEFPPGWQAWFEGMRERRGAVTGATDEAIIAVLLQRPVAPPPRPLLALNRWQAFSTLWRQEWQPPGRDERWLRALAATVSGLVHVVFVVAFLWLGIVQIVAMSAPPRGEETVVQVEFLGAGAPERVGGGQTPAPAPAPEPADAPKPRPATAAEQAASTAPSPRLPPLPEAPEVEVPRLPAEQPRTAERQVPEPQPPEQPLALSKPVPDRGSFLLPPPTLEVPDAGATRPARQLSIAQLRTEAPEPVAEIRPTVPPIEIEVEIAAPVLPTRSPALVVRDIPGPLPPVEPPAVATPAVAIPELEPRVPRIAERSVPMPPVPEPPASERRVAERASTQAPDAALPEPRSESEPQPQSEPEPEPMEPQPVAGTGPRPVPAPGGWPAPKVDDDWDLAERRQPGAEAGQPPGLYDSDGSVNLGDVPGSASPGLPPGTVTEEIADLDRAGTWLRRAPNDYEPSAFAQYWRPNETLVAEWVRKSITTVRIPIPGTSKSIVCKTILLAVGGACGIDDPNLNDQPATARPPPDIPFKPGLQEGNGSVPPAG